MTTELSCQELQTAEKKILRNLSRTCFCSKRGRASVSRVIQKERGAIWEVIRDSRRDAASPKRFSPYNRWNSRYFPIRKEGKPGHLQGPLDADHMGPRQEERDPKSATPQSREKFPELSLSSQTNDKQIQKFQNTGFEELQEPNVGNGQHQKKSRILDYNRLILHKPTVLQVK